jgi:hypothetical protein
MTDVRPYGVAIQQAVAGGDLTKMKLTLAAAERYLAEHRDISSAIESLRIEIARLEAQQ